MFVSAFLLLVFQAYLVRCNLQTGIPHKEVIALTQSTFRKAIEDPANPKWLLKFYAPWCGHCKQLAPVLDVVAPQLEGKLAIGKIDCTVETHLCNEQKVRGYPTLKFSLDGEIHDYPGGRKESEIIAFANKLNRPAVQPINSLDDAQKYAEEQTDEGVIFLAFHPDANGQSVAEKVQSTHLTQVFAQVGRKFQVAAHFLLLDSSADTKDYGSAPFICRIEQNVAPRCFEPLDQINTVDLQKFVQANNVATVSRLGPHNFNKIGRNGRPLVVGVVDTDNKEQVEVMKRQLTDYALNGPKKIREKYYYGWFDGKQWQKFLAQFDIEPDKLPQVFVLNLPAKEFWQNATYGLNVDDFLEAVDNGTIKSKSASKGAVEDVMDKLYYALIEYRPWSIVLLVLLLVSFVVMITTFVAPGEDLRPPYPQIDTKKEEKQAVKACTTDETTEEEPKKDK